MNYICRHQGYYFAYCEKCRHYQILSPKDSCAYCFTHVDYVEQNQLPKKMPMLGHFNEYQLVHWLNKKGHITHRDTYNEALELFPRLVLQPTGEPVLLGNGDSLQEKVEAAQKLFICAPRELYWPYWDYPGTVGIKDGIFERKCYIEDELLFRLECGPLGRLFVRRGGLERWVRCWQKNVHDLMWREPWTEREVDMRELFWQGVLSPHSTGFDAKVWNSELAAIIAPDALVQLPGRVPLAGFEFGVLRRVPEEYRPTFDEPMHAEAKHLLQHEHTYNPEMLQLFNATQVTSPAANIPEYVAKYWGDKLNFSSGFSVFFWTRMHLIEEYENKLRSGVVI